MHHEFVPESATVNRERYKEVLFCLWDPVCWKPHKTYVAKNWVLLCDNALVHWLLLIYQQLSKHGCMVPSEPLYCPSLTPCISYLLLQIKDWLKCCHFENKAEVQVTWKIVLQEVARGDFQKCFHDCMNAGIRV